MFVEFKKILDNGLAGALVSKLNNKILVYGGSNFENKYDRVVHNKYYIYDLEFNLLGSGIGNIRPDSSIKIDDEKNNRVYYIFKNSIYEIYLDNFDLVENEISKLDFEISSGFGCIYKDKLIFGNDYMYELDLETKKIKKLEKTIFDGRAQSVYTKYKNYLYVLGGATNIAHLDSFRYDLENRTWEKLNDIPFSLLGAGYTKIDDKNMLIMGGFNKEVFDDAVIKLQDKNYKPIYFEKSRDSFKWNDNIIKYNLETMEFKILENSLLSRICGGTIIKKENHIYYLVLGEVKPGQRSTMIYKYEEEK